MNRKASGFRTLRGSSAHKHGPAAMKPGLFYPNQRRLRPSRWVRVLQALPATLALPAAALLLASCDPPASPPLPAAPASPNPADPSAPPPPALEVPTISGLPNMAQIEQRLNAQYAQGAQSTKGVEFTPPKTSGTTVSASITYADDQLLPMTIGSKVHRIKTITITREVDGKTIPTTVEYKDKTGTTQKTITSRYVPPPNVTANNVQQSLEGEPRFAEAEAEGPTLHISGEEKDGADNILRTFTATERTRGATTTLQTTYRRPDNEGFTETVTTENGILTRKEVIYPDKDAAAQNIKTETITYEKSESAMFYPAGQKLTLAVYRDADGEETKRDEAQADGSMLTTMRDKSTITTTTPADNVTLAVYRDAKSNITKSIKTTRTGEGGSLTVHKDADGTITETIETTRTGEGGTLAVHKDARGVVTRRLKTKKDKSSTTTERTAEGSNLIVNKDTEGREASRLETKSDGSTIKTVRTAEGGKLVVNKDAAGKETKRVETKSSGSTITTKPSAAGGTKELVIHSSVTVIEDKAFQNNELTSVIIGNSVQTIGDDAFSNNDLTSVTIGNSVKTIGKQAFQNNELTSVTIGNSIKTIGE